ncbi:MAG: DUF1294 domain-containing protein [Treponema sp.]|nr:DUF1294 domain-containing protein [Treponema sp.]
MNIQLLKYLGIYYAAISLLAFIFYGVDKHKAANNKWRIPELTLFSFALLGGSIGALIGMKVFHHKTRKASFWFVNILFLVLHALVVYKVVTTIK